MDYMYLSVYVFLTEDKGPRLWGWEMVYIYNCVPLDKLRNLSGNF